MPSLGSLIAKVSLDYADFELGADRSSQAALKMGNDIERAVTKALGTYKKSVGDMSAANDDLGASMARASAGAAALGESEDQATARIKDMVARSLDAQQALQQVASASQSAADGVGALGASADQVRSNVAAQTQAMIDAQRATVLMNDEMQALRTTMAQGDATFATLGDQYSRLDRAMATGKLSMQEYDAALAALGKDEDKRVQALNALTSKYDPLGAATRKLAADQALLDDAYKSGQLTTTQYQQALSGIKADQAVVELRRLADQEAQLERAFKSGQTSLADYRAGMAQIATSRAALSEIAGAAESAGAGMSHFGLGTAGARTEVLRLANDLANGNFGRFDQSAMVLAERMDLLRAAASPAGLAIIGVGAAAVAFIAAAEHVQSQMDAMNQALVLTGNYAGTTVDGLLSMAQAATAGGASFNTAADAVTQLAATGKLTAEEISGLGQTTADVATYTSMSVKQMVDEFTKLAEDPVKASVKLNDTYHYLTVSTYDQIDALVKQGDATGAAQLAVETFSHAMDDRTKEIAANEGIILAGWRDIKSMINGAIEAVGTFGATATPGQVVARLQANKAARLPIGQWDSNDEAELQKAIDAYQSAVKQAGDKARNDRQQQQLIDAKHAYDTWNAQFATPAEKRAKELQTYMDTIATPLNLSPDQQIADEQKINDKYKDKKTSTRSVGLIDKTQLTGEVQAVKDALAEELAAVSSAQKQLDALYKSGGVSESAYYQQTRDLIAQKYTDEIDAYNKEAALLAKGLSDRNLSAAQRAQINNQIRSDQTKASKATEDFFNAIADSAAKEDEVWQAYGQSQIDALNKQTDSLAKQDQGLKDQIDTYGMTKAAIDNLTVARTQHELAMEQEGLAQAKLNNLAPDTIKQYEQTVAALQNVLIQQQAIAADQSTLDALKSWQGTIDQIGTDFHNGFLQMLTNGQAGWDSFTKSLKNTFEATVVDALYKEFLKPFVVNVIANIAGLTGASGVASALLNQNGSSSGSGAIGYANNAMSAYSAYSNVSGYAASAIGSISGGLSSGAAATLANGMGGDELGNFIALKGLSAGGSSAASGAGASSGLLSAGSAIPIVGAVLAAMGINDSLYSKGWDIKNGMSYPGLVGADLGSSLLSGGLIAPGTLTIGATGAKLLDQGLTGLGLSNHVASLLSGTSIISALFGNKTPQVTAAGVQGTVTVADGFQGNDYADWYSKGGLFSSSKTGTQTSAATQDQIDAINGTVQTTVATITSLSTAIGGDDGLQGKLSQFQYSIRNDWSNQTNVTKSLTDLSNSLVDAVYPLDQYQQTGETLAQTATRLTTVFNSTNDLASLMGKSVEQAFGAVGLAGANTRLQLVAAAGGIDTFNSEVAAYYSAYFSTSEQLSRSQDQMTQSFAALGLALPQSKDAFRDVVSSLDLTTTAGQNTFAALMVLAPAFDQYTQSMQQAADAQQSLWDQYFSAMYTPSQQLAMSTSILQEKFNALGVAMPQTNADFEALVEHMDTSTQPVKDLQNALLALAPSFAQVTSASDQAAQTQAQNVQTALGDVQTAYNNQAQAINANITSITNFITQLTNLKQSLSLGSLSTLSPQDKYNAEKQLFESTSASAEAGDATAQSNLPQVAQDFLTASQAYNASSQAYVDDYNAVQSALDQNIATAQQQLSAAQQQLDATNQMVQGILNLNQTAETLSQALQAYFSAGGTASAADGSANTYGGGAGSNLNLAQVQATADPTTGLIPYSAANPYGPMGGYTVADWQAANAAGVSDATKAALGMTQGPDGTYGWYANGSHAGGLDSVPFDGYRAELHKGEAVVTSANNQKLSQMLSIDWSRFGNNDQTALLNEIKALRAEVAATRQSQQQIAAVTLQQGQQQHADNQAAMSKQARQLKTAADAAQQTATHTGRIAQKR
ncbi:phage tail length tape measure family protein [Paraburkholderia fungorum]|uniref:phage tail length tape measure family protein n=1 Tax=Paraburkholderia fungorum TaxID=134537 RepID=UPI0038BAD1DD